MRNNLKELINRIMAQTEGALIASGANHQDVVDFLNQIYKKFDQFITEKLPDGYDENEVDYYDEEKEEENGYCGL